MMQHLSHTVALSVLHTKEKGKRWVLVMAARTKRESSDWSDDSSEARRLKERRKRRGDAAEDASEERRRVARRKRRDAALAEVEATSVQQDEAFSRPRTARQRMDSRDRSEGEEAEGIVLTSVPPTCS